jgi:hypothetical protein
MPRRDGFPTNRELQIDFTSAAHGVFVAAAERGLESKIDLYPAFEDKPLDHLYLSIVRNNEVPEGSPQAVHAEQLYITPLHEVTAADLRYDVGENGIGHLGNELFRDASDEVVEHYRALASIIGETLITNELRFGQIPVNGIEAEWTAKIGAKGWRTRHAGTFKERPSKQSLVSAKFFAEEAAVYVQSEDFDKSTAIRLADYAYGHTDKNPNYQFKHAFGFEMTTRLPLNGHEPRSFLNAYARNMSSRLEVAMLQLARLEDLGAPSSLKANWKRRVEIYQSALNSATKFLD